MTRIIKKEWIHHIEFAIAVILIGSILAVEFTREVSVDVEIDATVLEKANVELTSEIDRLISLQEIYGLDLEELRSLSARGGLDRLSSEQAVVGCAFYIDDEPFFYYVSLKEYMEAEYNIIDNSDSNLPKDYIRPLTADIEFLARQFIQRYPDKTDRALAILTLIQGLERDENAQDRINHPTVTLMRGGKLIDLVIACGALLEAADINCAILIFGCQGHSAIGISDIDFKKFKREIGETAIITYEGREYLICDLTYPSLTSLKGSQETSDAGTVVSITPYVFP